MDELSTKSQVCFNEENLPITSFTKTFTIISLTKVWSDPKVNPEIEKHLNPLATKPIFYRKKACT